MRWWAAALVMLWLATNISAGEVSAVRPGGISCPIASLQTLSSLSVKAFRVETFSISGQSAEGGTLALLSRKRVVERARADLFGESGKTTVTAARIGGDGLFTVRWLEYERPLPHMPVRIKKTTTAKGYVCSGLLIRDRREVSAATGERDDEFMQVATWLSAELKSRDVTWDVRLPRKGP